MRLAIKNDLLLLSLINYEHSIKCLIHFQEIIQANDLDLPE